MDRGFLLKRKGLVILVTLRLILSKPTIVLSGNGRPLEAELYGEHKGQHPSMDDLNNRLSVQIRVTFVSKAAERPSTAFVDYHGRIKLVAEYDKLYDAATNNEIKFDHDGSDTKRGYRKGWTTAHIKANFHFEDV